MPCYYQMVNENMTINSKKMAYDPTKAVKTTCPFCLLYLHPNCSIKLKQIKAKTTSTLAGGRVNPNDNCITFNPDIFFSAPPASWQPTGRAGYFNRRCLTEPKWGVPVWNASDAFSRGGLGESWNGVLFGSLGGLSGHDLFFSHGFHIMDSNWGWMDLARETSEFTIKQWDFSIKDRAATYPSWLGLQTNFYIGGQHYRECVFTGKCLIL